MMEKRGLLRILWSLPGIILLILLSACEEQKPESVADQLIGRWGIEAPVHVTVRTDFCTGTLEQVATENWSAIVWDIEKTADDLVVGIAMTYSRSNFAVTNSSCTFSTGYAPEPSPIFLQGYINNETVTVMYGDDEVGVFDYTEDSITGDLTYGYCMIYCQEITTEPEGMISLKKL